MPNLTVFKYPLRITAEQSVSMPAGAEILRVARQGAQISMWARVDLNRPTMTRRILLCGTGHQATSYPYLGTLFEGDYVWHLFDGGES